MHLLDFIGSKINTTSLNETWVARSAKSSWFGLGCVHIEEGAQGLTPGGTKDRALLGSLGRVSKALPDWPQVVVEALEAPAPGWTSMGCYSKQKIPGGSWEEETSLGSSESKSKPQWLRNGSHRGQGCLGAFLYLSITIWNKWLNEMKKPINMALKHRGGESGKVAH